MTCVFGEQALRDMGPEPLGKMLGDVDLPSWINFPDFERVRWVNTGAGARSSAALPYHRNTDHVPTMPRYREQRRRGRCEPAHACTLHAACFPLTGVHRLKVLKPARMLV